MQPIRNILSRLFGDALGRDIATLASGNAIAQILHLIAVPFLMLLYRPSDFGIYAVYLSAVAILAVISALRYDFAILVATSRRSVFSLLTLCTGMVGAWCALLEFVFIAVASIEIPHRFPALPLRFLPFLPLGVCLSSLYTLCLQFATRSQEYKALRSARIVYSGATLMAQTTLFFVFRDPVGLIIGEAFGRLVGVLILSRLVLGDWRSSRTSVTIRSVVVAARRYSRFARYLVVVELFSTISRNAPVTFFAIFFGTAVAGVYGQAQRLCGAPLTLLSQAVGRVFVGRLALALRDNIGTTRSIFRDVSIRLVIMAVMAVAGVAAVAAVLPWILGEDWRGLGPALVLLLPSFFALFVASPIAVSLDVLNRQRLHLLWEAVRLGAVAGWILFGVFLSLDFETVLFGYSLVLACCLSVLYALCRRTVLTNA